MTINVVRSGLKKGFTVFVLLGVIVGPLSVFAHGPVPHDGEAFDTGHDVYEEVRTEEQLFAAAQQALAVPNLVAAYGMNETSGLTVFDQSGSNNTATVNGNAARTTGGKYGGAVQFDGNNDFLSIPDNASLDLTTGTIEAWVKPTAGNRYHGIFSKGTANTDESDNYSMEINSSNRPYCVVGNGSSARVVTAPSANAVTLNVFTHIACTWDGSMLRLYINGTQVASGSYTLIPWNNTAPLVIGQHAGNADRFLGVIDEARVYNRALSQSEIQADMNLPIEVDSEFPAVSLTAPTDGATVSSTTAVTATASDNVGIAGVQFMLNGANLGAEDTTAPYSVAWDTRTATNGTHTLTARARDAAGNATDATSVSVTVNNPPQLVITSPTQGGTISSTTVPITYTMTGDTEGAGVHHVHFYMDGGPEKMDLTLDGSYQMINIAAGSHVLNGHLVRVDHSKIDGTDAVPVNFQTVLPDTEAPTVSISAPTAGQTVSGAVTVSATTTDNIGIAGVQFMLNGANLGSEDTTAPYSVTWNTPGTSNGSHTLTARARDAAGNTTTSSGITVTVTNTNLVAAYGFNEGAGTTVADQSGNGNTGTLSGATWSATGRYGGALSFNGSNTLVNIPDANSLDLTNGMTLEAWVRPTTLSGWRAILGKENGSSNLAYTLMANNNTSGSANQRPVSQIRIGSNTRTVTGTTKLPVNTWTHVASTYDGATFRLYINGTQVTSAAWTGNITTTNNQLRIGGIPSLGGRYFNGLIDEVRIYNRALSQSEIQTDLNTPLAGGTPGDTTAPSVSVTAPSNGATVSGTTAVTASATDTVGVVGVQFLLDGANLGTEDTTAPYSVSWNTTSATNGSHTLAARARDAAGNATTSPVVSVTVNNINDPSILGAWSAPFSLPIVALHLAQLNTGKILMWEGQDNGGISARVWDPATGTLTATPNNATNLFCAGHVQLGDGRIMTMGGHDGNPGVKDANVFNPATQTWSTLPPMNFARWYPTGTVMSDGKVVVTSGSEGCFDTSCAVAQVEVYDPATNAWSTLPASANYADMGLYPNTFALSNGKLLSVGAGYDGRTDTRVLDLATNIWTIVDSLLLDGQTAVMYAPDKVMVTGKNYIEGSVVNGHGRTYVLDMTQASPAWVQTASMNFPRVYNTSTLLPDGTVVVTSGGTTTSRVTQSQAVLPAEIWSPTTQTWTTMASAQIPRFYHSAAILLPDGRVLVSGSGADEPMVNQYNGELYSPPYLFKGPRPTITSAPASVNPGESFFVETPDGASISRVTMIRTGTMTHSFNPDQRFVELSFTQTAGGLNVTAPADNLVPPGHYLLFILNGNGVPSVAPFVRVQ